MLWDALIACVQTAAHIHNDGIAMRREKATGGIVVISASYYAAQLAQWGGIELRKVVIYSVDQPLGQVVFQDIAFGSTRF